jgi:hypothetical protein
MTMFSLTSRWVALTVVLSLLVGCTGYKRVSLVATPPDRSMIVGQVAVGDTLRVVTSGGTQQEIRVKAIEGDALVGERGERLAFTDIVFVERRGINVGKTVGLGVGIFGACMLAFGMVFVVSGTAP